MTDHALAAYREVQVTLVIQVALGNIVQTVIDLFQEVRRPLKIHVANITLVLVRQVTVRPGRQDRLFRGISFRV